MFLAKSDSSLYFDITESFERNFDTVEKLLKKVRGLNQHVHLDRYRDFRNTVNAAGYVAVVEYDFHICYKEILVATRDWSRRYFSRQACMLMYESINDLQKLLGKEFRGELRRLSIDNGQVETLNSICEELNRFKRENCKKLKEIRNAAMAHRDKEIYEQIRVIDAIDFKWVSTNSNSFTQMMTRIMDFLQSILAKNL